MSSAGLDHHPERDHSLLLEQYAFSNAIASSVKLGMLEASLEKLVDSIEFLSDDLKGGRDVKMSESGVLKKSGEIFALRHVVNLSSDLLDTPDFYWDRENLESLYHVTRREKYFAYVLSSTIPRNNTLALQFYSRVR